MRRRAWRDRRGSPGSLGRAGRSCGRAWSDGRTPGRACPSAPRRSSSCHPPAPARRTMTVTATTRTTIDAASHDEAMVERAWPRSSPDSQSDRADVARRQSRLDRLPASNAARAAASAEPGPQADEADLREQAVGGVRVTAAADVIACDRLELAIGLGGPRRPARRRPRRRHAGSAAASSRSRRPLGDRSSLAARGRPSTRASATSPGRTARPPSPAVRPAAAPSPRPTTTADAYAVRARAARRGGASRRPDDPASPQVRVRGVGPLLEQVEEPSPVGHAPRPAPRPTPSWTGWYAILAADGRLPHVPEPVRVPRAPRLPAQRRTSPRRRSPRSSRRPDRPPATR